MDIIIGEILDIFDKYQMSIADYKNTYPPILKQI